MAKQFLIPIMLAVLAAFVMAYGAGVLPGGALDSNTPSHDAARVVNRSGRTIDANLNGIIDQADSCLVCGGAPAGGGGGPPVAGGTLVDMRVMASRRPLLFAAQIPNADVGGITFPYAVPGNPTTSRFVIEGCWAGTGEEWYTTAGATDLTIDWANKRISGHTSRVTAGSPTLHVSAWDVSNALSNTNYASTPVYSGCGGYGGCPQVNVNFATKTINGLPAGCSFLTATLLSFA